MLRPKKDRRVSWDTYAFFHPRDASRLAVENKLVPLFSSYEKLSKQLISALKGRDALPRHSHLRKVRVLTDLISEKIALIEAALGNVEALDYGPRPASTYTGRTGSKARPAPLHGLPILKGRRSKPAPIKAETYRDGLNANPNVILRDTPRKPPEIWPDPTIED